MPGRSGSSLRRRFGAEHEAEPRRAVAGGDLNAARLLDRRFPVRYGLSPETTQELPRILAGLGLAGAAVYDALIALVAVEHGAELATRDARALATYERVGARVVVAA